VRVLYINFKINDTAKNLLPFDFLMMGESYHNNHHKFGGRANFGIRWFEFDPTYPVILILNGLGTLDRDIVFGGKASADESDALHAFILRRNYLKLVISQHEALVFYFLVRIKL
jgi:hypothetical protein